MAEEQLHFFDFKEKNSKRRQISLPLDTLILLFIIIVLLFLLSFSLGVERGRRIVYINEAKKDLFSDYKEPFKKEEILLQEDLSQKTNEGPALNDVVKNISNVNIENKDNVASANISDAKIKAEKEILPNKQKEKQEKEKQKEINKERYVIQIASYTNKEAAELEFKKLQKKGYKAFISKKGNFLVLFVGEFSSKIDAEKALRSLKNSYSDCFLKNVK